MLSILQKIRDFGSKIRSESTELKLKTLSNNIFPYSCLVADDVILTKNGEVLQMIEILLDDFKLNQEGGLRDKIREAISENTNDLRTAFWIQTVKRKKARMTKKKSVIKQEFLKRLYDVSQQMEESLNNYSTSVYITIIRQGINFKLKPSYLKNYLSTILLEHKHNKEIDKNIKEVKQITNNIKDMLSLYSPQILSTRKEGDNKEYSDLIETLYFLVNFEDKKIQVCPIDISRLVNNSEYLFENGIMAMRNFDTKKIRTGMSFTLKEVPRITMSNVSDIINNTRAEMIVTEYISYVDQKVANSKFAEQKSFLQNREYKDFQEEVGLGFLDESANAKYCQSSLSVLVLASSVNELQTFVVDTLNMFSKHGVVMAREDVSLERNYYAMFPANFSFIHRLTIHDAKEVGCFCYSYTPQENDTSMLLGGNVLFNIGTLKSNPVPIGLDKTRSNVMIGGLQNSGKSVLSNFIIASLMRDMDANLYLIEFNCRSRAFISALGGSWYRVSMNKQNHTATFNALNLDLFTNEDKKDNYLFELFSLLLTANNVLITPEITTEIKKVIENIKEYSKTHKKIAIHDVRSAFKNTSLEQELLSWHSIGRYYHLFDNRDDVFNNHNILSLFLDESTTKNGLVLATIINHIFVNIIQRSKHSNKPTIVLLEEPFLAFGNGFFKSKLNSMIERMAKNNVYCIFKSCDIENESSTIVDFTSLVNSCGLQMHFSNKYADSNYGRVYRLEKLEYMAIKTLANYEGRNLMVKNSSGIYSCKFDLDDYPKIVSLLSDKGEAQGKIFQIKEGLQTDSCDRWVPAYFGNFSSSDDAEAQRAIKKELKAIQDIKRLLES